MSNEFVLDADSENPLDLTDESEYAGLHPTKDVEHSILEPMKIKPLNLPQFVIDEMKAGYEETCVNDFGDMYHMPEEERRKTFQFYEAFKELRTVKIKHRQLTSFIEAYRIMIKVLCTVAEVNGIYSKKEFIKKVLNGKIVVSGLKKPKYIGRGKKDVDWNVVADYIADTDKDPNDFLKNKFDAFFELVDDDDIKDMEEYLGEDLISYIDKTNIEMTDEELEEFDPDGIETAGKNIVTELSKKEQRKLLKDNKAILIGLKDSKKLSNTNKKIYGSFAYELTKDAFDEVRERDEKTGTLDIPKFKGNALKQKDVDKYIAAVDEYEREHTKIEKNGRYYTIDEIEELELKELLEKNGYDIRKFYSYKEDEKKIRAQRKKDEKKIERLKKTLRETKKRFEERDSNGKVNSKKKKKSKKVKKKEKSMKKKITPSGYSDFDEYAKSMESWDE